MGGPPAWELGEVLTTPPCKILMLRNIHMRDAYSGVDLIGLAKDRDRWRTLVSAVMNFRVP